MVFSKEATTTPPPPRKSSNEESSSTPQSLLVQALAVPSLNDPHWSHDDDDDDLSSHDDLDPILPRHSDFTVPTSNKFPQKWSIPSPPSSTQRRNVFAKRVQSNYHRNLLPQYNPQPVHHSTQSPILHHHHHDDEESQEEDDVLIVPSTPIARSHTTTTTTTPIRAGRSNRQLLLSPLTPHSPIVKPKKQNVHETIHAQSLLLGLAFLAVWSPSNLMAPNLTEMADAFGFDAGQRDLYLGSYCALATSVLSLPISAGIGILADLVSRKHLFVATIVGGALASWATAISPNYKWLFGARLINGGFMSGSVPVAFSLLGDLFETHERNAASSGLTAMMGMGIILGQVYAGVVVGGTGGMTATTLTWRHPFYVSSLLTLGLAILVVLWVQEPIRGGKEQVLQDMLRQGTRYDRQLTWAAFWNAVRHNRSNRILMWQGFFSSLPWGIVFVFLNDFLSQEKHLSVPDATYMVFLFGIGCAIGGVLGGACGQALQQWNRRGLPLFMAASTFLGILPFCGLLNSPLHSGHTWAAIFYSLSGGCIASLPSVNVRPCLINVNAPETRGATLTAANLVINLARGVGPSCITLLISIFHVDRQFAFNLTLALFWTISSIQLLFLAKTLPEDEDAMQAELALYAELALRNRAPPPDDAASLVSIEDRITSFDGTAARESIVFVKKGIEELQEEVRQSMHLRNPCRDTFSPNMVEQPEDDSLRRNLWIPDHHHYSNGVEHIGFRPNDEDDDDDDDPRPTEATPLIV